MAGIKCPECSSEKSIVIDTRPTHGKRRRRRCLACNSTYATIEFVEGQLPKDVYDKLSKMRDWIDVVLESCSDIA